MSHFKVNASRCLIDKIILRIYLPVFTEKITLNFRTYEKKKWSEKINKHWTYVATNSVSQFINVLKKKKGSSLCIVLILPIFTEVTSKIYAAGNKGTNQKQIAGALVILQ